VTGPLSKLQMQQDGFSEIGHTPLLQRLSRAKNVYMVFLGKHFNVVLLSGHIPLREVTWTPESLDHCLDVCLRMRERLASHQSHQPIAVLGLNPHAGEEGLLGTEEIALRTQLKKWGNKVIGPLVPDVAFLPTHWSRFAFYLCLYHDQALIPFKMMHEKSGIQVSGGLPFIRTSVSHGTAKDIFGKDQAEATSMKQALLWTAQQ